MDHDEILKVLRAFEEQGLEYVLIDAAAMGFHGIVRATEDLDLLIRSTPENVERLKRAFRGIRVWVATPRALYRLKKDTVRPLDREDAEALRRQFDLEGE